MAIVIRAFTPEQVAEMVQEKVEAIKRHCRTQALKVLARRVVGRARGVSLLQRLPITSAHGPDTDT